MQTVTPTKTPPRPPHGQPMGARRKNIDANVGPSQKLRLEPKIIFLGDQTDQVKQITSGQPKDHIKNRP